MRVVRIASDDVSQFGPPVRSEGGLGVCELCFHGATDEEIAECEMVADPDDLESRLVEQMERRTQRPGQTWLHSCQDASSLCGLCRPLSMKRTSAPGSESRTCFISSGSVRGSPRPCMNVTGTRSSLSRPS